MKPQMQNIPEAVKAERKRIAKILHDGLCQELMGATLMAQVVSAGLSKEAHGMSGEAEKLKNILNKAAAEVHSLYQLLELPPSERDGE